MIMLVYLDKYILQGTMSSGMDQYEQTNDKDDIQQKDERINDMDHSLAQEYRQSWLCMALSHIKINMLELWMDSSSAVMLLWLFGTSSIGRMHHEMIVYFTKRCFTTMQYSSEGTQRLFTTAYTLIHSTVRPWITCQRCYVSQSNSSVTTYRERGKWLKW